MRYLDLTNTRERTRRQVITWRGLIRIHTEEKKYFRLDRQEQIVISMRTLSE